jgi:hypothetical protein
MKYIIIDDFGNQLYNVSFNDYDDAWSFVYEKFPVVYNDDGTQDDREDDLDEHRVIEKELYLSNSFNLYS